MEICKGSKIYTHDWQEVIWLLDKDHTPHNKHSGEVESKLRVEIRAPLKSNWVSFHVGENTTTKNYGVKKDTTREKAIWFTISREQFDAIVAHVKREKDFV